MRPIPLALKEMIENEVLTMLKLGVIEESNNPWRSTPTLVPKPDRTVQFCIDILCPIPCPGWPLHRHAMTLVLT